MKNIIFYGLATLGILSSGILLAFIWTGLITFANASVGTTVYFLAITLIVLSVILIFIGKNIGSTEAS